MKTKSEYAKLMKRLQKPAGLAPPTSTEADELMAGPDHSPPMSEERIQKIADAVTTPTAAPDGELLPCICENDTVAVLSDTEGWFWVECDICHLESCSEKNRGEAVKDWSKLVVRLLRENYNPAPATELDRLRELENRIAKRQTMEEVSQGCRYSTPAQGSFLDTIINECRAAMLSFPQPKHNHTADAGKMEGVEDAED